MNSLNHAADHPIQAYADALYREHEESFLVSHSPTSLVELLASHAELPAKSGRVVVVRGAGPSEPFGHHSARGK